MIWYDHMLLGKTCRKRAGRLKDKISRRQVHPGVYLIVLPEHGSALLEVIPSMQLLQEAYPAGALAVVGMAGTQQEAFSLVEKIIGDMYRERGDVNDIAAYLEQYR